MARTETVTDARGFGHVTTYDALGRVIQRQEPAPGGSGTGPVTQTTYGALGWTLATTDPLGNVTTYLYEDFGKKVTTRRPHPVTGATNGGPTTTVESDAAGNVVRETDALGRVVTHAYDELNRRISTTLPDPTDDGIVNPPVTTYAYDKLGRVILTTDALGNHSATEYDARGRRTKTTLPNPATGLATGPETLFAYDDAGQLLSVTDALGSVTTYEYDLLGRTILVTEPDPDGAGTGLPAATTATTYDAVGNVLSVTDALGHATSYAYDAHNNRVSSTDAEGGVTAFTYNDAGNRLSLTDPVGNETTWQYDGLGRVTLETNELAATRTFAYDLAGQLTAKTDRLGRVTEYEYDHLLRRTAEVWKDGATTVRTLEFAYDAAGQLTNASDPAAEFAYTYDVLGRTTTIGAEIAGLTPVVSLAQGFDLVGNRTSVAATIGTTADFATAYLYDRLHRQTRATQTGQAGGNAVAVKRADWEYNGLSQTTAIQRFANAAGTQSVAETTFTYDNAHRLTSLQHGQGATDLAAYDYLYDEAGRIASIDSLWDEQTDYTHDDTNQLLEADYVDPLRTDEDYGYDANGNRVTNGFTVGSNNQLLSDGVYDYEYDAEGNRTAKETIATGERVEYAWDWRNRLTGVTFKDSAGQVVQTVNYQYDVFNRLVGRTVDSNGPASGGESVQFFINDGNQIALRFDGPFAADVSHRYLWGPGTDQLIAEEQVATVSVAGSVIWPLSDHLGTPRDIAVFDVGTGITTIANHREFDSFGNLISETNSSLTTDFRFTGRWFDIATGLQTHWHRWYDPASGKWTAEDPIGFDGDVTNLARIVYNNVTSVIDSTGLIGEIVSSINGEVVKVIVPGVGVWWGKDAILAAYDAGAIGHETMIQLIGQVPQPGVGGVAAGGGGVAAGGGGTAAGGTAGVVVAAAWVIIAVEVAALGAEVYYLYKYTSEFNTGVDEFKDLSSKIYQFQGCDAATARQLAQDEYDQWSSQLPSFGTRYGEAFYNDYVGWWLPWE